MGSMSVAVGTVKPPSIDDGRVLSAVYCDQAGRAESRDRRNANDVRCAGFRVDDQLVGRRNDAQHGQRRTRTVLYFTVKDGKLGRGHRRMAAANLVPGTNESFTGNGGAANVPFLFERDRNGRGIAFYASKVRSRDIRFARGGRCCVRKTHRTLKIKTHNHSCPPHPPRPRYGVAVAVEGLRGE